MKIETTMTHWDCECVNKYIHPKSRLFCTECGADQCDRPDSHIEEVRDHAKHFLIEPMKEQR